LYGGLIGAAGVLVQWGARRMMSLYLYSAAFFVSMLALNVIYVAYSGALTDLVPDSQRGQANGTVAHSVPRPAFH
jgi:hypothetical protein